LTHPETPLRWTKAGRTRTYHVREIEDALELWVTAQSGCETKARKLATFANPEGLAPFLETVAQDLRAGGWLES